MLIFVSGLVLTSSISGRNACLSEEVTFTCTADEDALSGEMHEAFGELTMHYTTPPSRGEFRAKIVSYDSNQNCLVSSLSFRATSLHMHGLTVSKHVPSLLANPHVLVQRSLHEMCTPGIHYEYIHLVVL